MGRDRQVAVPRYLKSRTVNEGIPDERNGGIHGGGRRDLADLLPADEPGAKPQDAVRVRRQRRFWHRPQRQFQWLRLETAFLVRQRRSFVGSLHLVQRF